MTQLRIGIVCYPTYGGSGVIASEIGMGMAKRGHRVHFIAAGMPRRVDRYMSNIFFHEVEMRDYPVFVSPPYAIGLASKIVEVATYEKLNILHVHYAVPHATSAYLAKQVLGEASPKIITTLHGTDITLVGNDRSYLPITRFSIVQSDRVTTPSMYLKSATYDKLNVSSEFPIDVIPNFVDTEAYKPMDRNAETGACPCFRDMKEKEPVLTHVSNFREVKRIPDIIEVFAKVNAEVPSRLIFIGDGPERSKAEHLVYDKKLTDRVCFLGKLETFADIIATSTVFLLPSESESFGLAALEALSCGVPVVASNAGGIPEVVIHGESGFLSDIGDVDDMAKNTLRIIREPELAQKMRQSARNRAVTLFANERLIEEYEKLYLQALG